LQHMRTSSRLRGLGCDLIDVVPEMSFRCLKGYQDQTNRWDQRIGTLPFVFKKDKGSRIQVPQ
jgi:hypothetical protein